jgi:hypothetical protein
VPESDLEVGGLRMLEVDNRVIIPELTHVRFIITSGVATVRVLMELVRNNTYSCIYEERVSHPDGVNNPSAVRKGKQ